MCGIVGCNYKIDNFYKAIELLNHRGPDNLGFYEYKNHQFGHTRLSIIDLNEEANQPMVFDDVIITFNGEIYNYKELIKDENLKCKTKSDTEVILRLYQKYNINFLNKLEGMFSFCIFDKKDETFFCARDRFGKKPFYYYLKNNDFIFASEIKSILSILNTTPSLNKDALYQYLSFLAPIEDNTFYKDIKKLPAGHFIIFKNNQLTIKKYYDLDEIKTSRNNEKEILENIEELLINSVKKRLVSDVEVATLLSGGIDSSLTSAFYAKYSDKQINTFCIGYDEHTHYSELPFARIVSKHINSNHNELIIQRKDFIQTIDKMLEHTDEPFADSASIPTYLLSEFINKKGIKVALSGEGSDESFLGYDNYFKMLDYYKTEGSEEEFNLTKEWEFNNRAFNKQHIYQTCGETFTEKQKEKLFLDYKIKDHLKNYKKCNYDDFKWLTYVDFKVWIAEVLMTKIDRMSMAHSLELRAPFLDHKLVEYMLSVDKNIKCGNTNKYLLKQIAQKYLPKEIVHRQKKGFSSPFIEWIHEEYKDEILEKIKLVNKELNIFNEDFVKFIYNESKEKRFKQHLWNIYIFSRWFEKVYL
ncbi:asparagine synthase (glutamine-hydrolyzing) [Malaciobacter molluscorum]|uniref:asparagine synthase (glutamine-hydrolyzing) n=1 Tax=Malaciobacter molluscorum TaxID=1032072 RepID=UPI00100A63A5|nr:asparagine synthase (glutamine-hydrolyzing) [Malaciobacter molluscorum]RXJ93853.1 asparagine synthase (glutamine-hydrolyzing) [Malaciobacter molluscorum]